MGTTENKENYVTDKVITWIEEVNKLSEIACTQPHTAYSAFIHGRRHRFTYTMRTIVDLWPSGLRCRTRDPTVVSSNPALGHQC